MRNKFIIFNVNSLVLNLDEKSYSHICTGGGASLEYLSSGRLPGIDVLKTEC